MDDADDRAALAEYERLFEAACIPHRTAPQAAELDPYSANLAAVAGLEKAARSSEMRDVPMSPAMHRALFAVLMEAWEAVPVASAEDLENMPPAPSDTAPSVVTGTSRPGEGDLVQAAPAKHPRLAFLEVAGSLFARAVAFEEFDGDAAAPCVPDGFARAIVQRCLSAPQAEQSQLRHCLQSAYKFLPRLRPRLRRTIGEGLRQFAARPTPQPGVTTLLAVVSAVLRGLTPGPSAEAVAGQLLSDCLAPLHETNALVSETSSLLGMYHGALMVAVERAVEAAPSRAIGAVEFVAAAWLPAGSANSPKCVLLLQELDRLLVSAVPEHRTGEAIAAAAGLLAEAAASEYSRLAQRLLTMFKPAPSRARLAPHAPALCRVLLPGLLRTGSKHWNATVNKQTRTVLAWLADSDAAAFAREVPAAMRRGFVPGAAAAAVGVARGGGGGVTSSASSPAEQGAASSSAARHRTARLTGAGGKGPSAKRAKGGGAAGTRAAAASAGGGGMPPPPQRSAAGAAPSLARQAALQALAREQERRILNGAGASREPVRASHDVVTEAGASSGPGPIAAPAGGMVGRRRGGGAADGSVGGLVASGMATSAPFARKSGGVSVTAEQPPLTVTGVAPWGGGVASAAFGGRARVGVSGASKLAAAADVTGSADGPADDQDREASGPVGADGSDDEGPAAVALPDDADDMDRSLAAAAGHVRDGSARARLWAYLLSLRPEPVSAEVRAASEAAAAPVETADGALALTPTLLPGLKLHDLVFGRVLGSGSFSTVKWCKRIVKGAPQSAWPEFAAKVVSSDTIRRLGYERSVEREVAVLRRMAHPGVARLVASFRFGDGAYLLLEFGARGDLHSHITTLGSLSDDSARFAVGELAASLSAVHRAGFAYGDLKPENVLLTAGGHVKLTDFGGARPVTDAARGAVRAERNVLRRLPDGSWRAGLKSAAATATGRASGAKDPEAGAEGAEAGSDEEEMEEDEDEDTRVEATAVYMAPELVRGGQPSAAADCWALGCVLYFALAGRPPVWAETQADVMRTIVNFDVSSHFPDDFDADARSLVTLLLSPEPEARLAGGTEEDPLAGIKTHPFFAPLGCPVDDLHSRPAPPMAEGAVAPQTDARWSKRQFSMFYAPVPHASDVETGPVARSLGAAVEETDVERGAPFGAARPGGTAVGPFGGVTLRGALPVTAEEDEGGDLTQPADEEEEYGEEDGEDLTDAMEE